MTKFSKSRWASDGDEIRLGIEFSKVDKSRRLVSGWATLDNVDTEGDVVTAEASRDAFARARGNLREMHKKDSAIGRVVSFKEKTFRAPDGQKYSGIFVTAYVSKGSQDAWEKVLDGTLSGFSIGGSIISSEDVIQKNGESIRKVNKYDLTELSLVDNPGNQYANVKEIFKIRKSADGSVTSVSGMIEEQNVLNVFYCNTDGITMEEPSETYDCPVCETGMLNIGFIEDGSDRDEKVTSLLTKYLSPEGGETMTKKIEKSNPEPTDETVETGHEAGDPTEVPTPAVDEETVEEVEATEEPEEVEEVHDEGEEIAKQIDGLKVTITEALSKNRDEIAEEIDALRKQIKSQGESFEQKASEFEKKLTELDNNLDVAKSRLAGFEKSLNKINSGTALRKSADLDSAETEPKSETTWNGAFSVDNLF